MNVSTEKDVLVVEAVAGDLSLSVRRDQSNTYSIHKNGADILIGGSAEEAMRTLAGYVVPEALQADDKFRSVRRMKTPEATGPFTGEQIASRMLAICGCAGRYDCDCVSVQNQARRDLWTEHNQARRASQSDAQ